jgi:hypothetical protein
MVAMRRRRALAWTGWLVAAALVGACDDPSSAPPPPAPAPSTGLSFDPADVSFDPAHRPPDRLYDPRGLLQVAPGAGFLEPDFELVDSNTHSATYGQVCSPRQRLGSVSAWYFGHAT